MKKAKQRFRYLKRLIEDESDIKELVDMFYFNKKAINFANKLQHRYMMNKYYDLTTIDLLLMVEQYNNIYDVQNAIYQEYESSYATSVWSNFIACLERELI